MKQFFCLALAVLTLPVLADVAPKAQRPPTAWVWQEPVLTRVPGALLDALRASGFAVQSKTMAELSAIKVLHREQLDLLVLPYGDLYPVDVIPALPGFCRQGGALMTMGGKEASFLQPVYATVAGVRKLTSTGETLATLTPVSDWKKTRQGPDDRVALTAQQAILSVSLDVQSYAYAEIVLAPLTASNVIFECEVRGDATTPRVCLEFQERDGSRWKRMIPLTTEWVTHRVHLAECAAYASKARGGPDDWLHPEQITRFWIGVTHSMAGKGKHHVDLRKMRFLQADVPSAQVTKTPRFVPSARRAGQWFGAETTLEPWAVQPPLFENRQQRDVTLGQVTRFQEGPYVGGGWAVLDLPNYRDTLSNSAAEAVAEAAKVLAAGVWLQTPQPSFRVKDGEVVMDVHLPLANPSAMPAQLTATLQVGKGTPVVREITLPARKAATMKVLLADGVVAPRLEQDKLEMIVTISKASGPILGPCRFGLDAREQLRATCDFMVKQAQGNAKLHGNAFIDNRGMRALLGAYEIFGNARYLDTALRWGETMLAEQRADGGYRMGYGITSRGEECYVADGGEIVVCILRLASYVKGAQRDRFLASADRYMAFRDAFRVPTGGIGVGWCLTDYGRRPTVRLDTPTRIYAPEINAYTIGCSLAGAYGHAVLRGVPALLRSAEADADWLMPRVKRINGAFLESFMFAHAFAGSEERRATYAEYIMETFLRPTLERPTAWWHGGGGRHALNLDGLAYALHRLETGPETRAEMYRALCAMYSPDLPQSIPDVIAKGTFNHDTWLYINFGTLGLVDVIKPMVSLDRWTSEVTGNR